MFSFCRNCGGSWPHRYGEGRCRDCITTERALDMLKLGTILDNSTFEYIRLVFKKLNEEIEDLNTIIAGIRSEAE